MIPKSGYRFSEKIMLNQEAKAKWSLSLIPVRLQPHKPQAGRKDKSSSRLSCVKECRSFLRQCDDKRPDINYEEASGPVGRDASRANWPDFCRSKSIGPSLGRATRDPSVASRAE